MNKPKFLIEKYTDKYRSLYQAIQIDLDRDKETDGKESYCARCNLNPNLTILLEKEYRDVNYKLLKREKLINDEWYFEEIKEQE